MVRFEMASTLAVFMVNLVLVFMELASTPVFAGKAGVYIFHEIQGSDPLQVKCTKGAAFWPAHHLSPQTLHFGERYGWDFNPSVWGTTKYHCTFGWGGRTKEVRVWTESQWLPHWKTIPRPCSHCWWHVKSDGFYLQPNDVDKANVSRFYVGWQ